MVDSGGVGHSPSRREAAPCYLKQRLKQKTR